MKLSTTTPHDVARFTPSPEEILAEYCDKCGFHQDFCNCRENLEQKIIEAQDELEELQEEYEKFTGYRYRGEIK